MVVSLIKCGSYKRKKKTFFLFIDNTQETTAPKAEKKKNDTGQDPSKAGGDLREKIGKGNFKIFPSSQLSDSSNEESECLDSTFETVILDDSQDVIPEPDMSVDMFNLEPGRKLDFK